MKEGFCQPLFLIFLVVTPLATNLALDFSTEPSLKLNCLSLGLEVSGEVFAILEVYSKFHLNHFLSFFVSLL
jgi:hypothetical protein